MSGGLDSDGQAVGFGGRARFGYGATDNLELAIQGSFTRTQAIEFDSAQIEAQRGTLFADATIAELAVGLRWSFGVEVWRALERLHPFVGVRGGGLLRQLTGQELLNSQSMVLLQPRNDLGILPFFGATAGIERRFGDHWFIGLAIDGALGNDYQHLGADLEVAWSWYR